MQKERLKIKDSQVKKNLKWHILRLLRLSNRTKQELIDKLSDMYLGYWQVNNELIDINLNKMANEDLIKYSSDRYRITEKGLDALGKKEKDIEQYYSRHLSKEACAMYSLWGNVGLSALEFIIGSFQGALVLSRMQFILLLGAPLSFSLVTPVPCAGPRPWRGEETPHESNLIGAE